MKNLFLTVVVCGVTSCVTTPSKPENTPDKVLSRSDDLDERPSWVKESEPFHIENGVVTALGQTSIPGDNRVEAAYRIAENNAKGLIAGSIEQRLDFVFQNAEEGTAVDSTQTRFIGAEAAKIMTSSLRPGKRYFEKIATTTDSGERVTRYKVFTAVTMPEADFKRAIQDAIRRAQGKGGLSADFADKVNKHWDQFTSGDSSSAPSSEASVH